MAALELLYATARAGRRDCVCFDSHAAAAPTRRRLSGHAPQRCNLGTGYGFSGARCRSAPDGGRGRDSGGIVRHGSPLRSRMKVLAGQRAPARVDVDGVPGKVWYAIRRHGEFENWRVAQESCPRPKRGARWSSECDRRNGFGICPLARHLNTSPALC